MNPTSSPLPPEMETPAGEPHKTKIPRIVLVLMLVFVVIASIAVWYLSPEGNNFFTKKNMRDTNLPVPSDTIPSITTSDAGATTIDEKLQLVMSSTTYSNVLKIKDSELLDVTSLIDTTQIAVAWLPHAEPIQANEQKLRDIAQASLDNFFETHYPDRSLPSVYLYRTGSMTAPQEWVGKTVYYLIVGSYGEMGGNMYFSAYPAIFDETLENFIVFSSGDMIYEQDNMHVARAVISHSFDELVAPQWIDLPQLQTGSFLTLTGWLQKEGTTLFDFKAPTNNVGGVLDVYTNEIATKPPVNPSFHDGTYGDIYFVDNQYRIVMPNGAQAIYDVIPYFFDADTVNAQKEYYGVQSKFVGVTWDNPTLHDVAYTPAGELIKGGCSLHLATFPNIVNNQPWFDEQNLKKIGTVGKLDTLYTLKSYDNNSYAKDVYDIGFEAAYFQKFGQGALSQETYDAFDQMSDAEKWDLFVADEPLVFWKDEAGYWRAYRKASYERLAECGKPVIYLYPEQSEDVHVKVEPAGGIKISDPEYGTNGWYVRATPEGTIHNYANNTSYESLFWEGYAYNYQMPCYGWVMAKDDVDTRVPALLKKYGLNEKESADFMEFWADKLKVKPYVFVTFISKQMFDDMAPLTVTPTPDSVIRVFMDYQALDTPMQLPEPYIKTPVRTGFTVVEWGGRLH